jgi:hypothetical protein
MDKEPPRTGPTGKFPPGFHEITKGGTGVIFIRPSAIRALEYPYFRYLYNEDQGMQGTEDIQFCNKLRAEGIKMYGNAGVTVGHYHSVELSSLWNWAESVYVKNNLDTAGDKSADCTHLDGESPSRQSVAEASPANAA